MQLQKSITNVLTQLSESLECLTTDEYRQQCNLLFNATIGQHVRHVIELYTCLYNGYETGIVNYEKRKRDMRIEQDKELAIELMEMIARNLEKENKELLLEASADEENDQTITIITNYYREIIYNLEHTVHHMALIRVGITEVSGKMVPDGFGVASSTIKYSKINSASVPVK